VSTRRRAAFLALCLAAGASACAQEKPAPRVALAQPAPPRPPVSADPLGPRPQVQAPSPYAPPNPRVFKLADGMTVWLVERHDVPLVSLAIAVPRGSAADPKGRGGLAVQAANMLDEGAGKLGSLEFAAAVDTLGARMRTGATFDYSYVGVTVLSKHLAPSLALIADAVVRPRFEDAEWRRVHALWINNLKNRASDADETADVVQQVTLYGDDHPYGHPIEGTLASAAKVGLGDVRAFYREAWRPEHAVAVVVGDVKREELESLLTKSFEGWVSKGPAPAPVTVPVALPPHAKVVLVDRQDAPQSVIALVRPGLAAGDVDAPLASRVNVVLGGSFISRLNQDLREEHGWSYGASSAVTLTRHPGSVAAFASVVTEHTGDAARAMLTDMQTFAASGPSDEEASISQRLARRELVDLYGTDEGAVFRLTRDAMMGLAPTYEADASVKRDSATRADLAAVAARDFDPNAGFLLVVGPADKVRPQLVAAGFGEPEMRDVDGKPVTRPKPGSKP
jgi:predicted Zn-dependent peptidase